MLKDGFKYAMSPELEKQAFDSIIELFTVQWEDTQKKNSREITALVLDCLVGACLIEHRADETPEHFTLLCTNQYLEKVRNELLSSATLPYVISGKDFPSIIENLKRISRAASTDSNYAEISKQLQHYITKILESASSNASAYQLRWVISVILSLIIGFGIAYIIASNNSYFGFDTGVFIGGGLAISVAALSLTGLIFKVVK